MEVIYDRERYSENIEPWQAFIGLAILGGGGYLIYKILTSKKEAPQPLPPTLDEEVINRVISTIRERTPAPQRETLPSEDEQRKMITQMYTEMYKQQLKLTKQQMIFELISRFFTQMFPQPTKPIPKKTVRKK